MLLFRSEISDLPEYVPPVRPSNGLLLAANELPDALPRSDLAAAGELLAQHSHRYPDAWARPLCDALETFHGLRPGEVVVTPGAIGALQALLLSAPVPGTVVYPWRSFEAYPGLVTQRGLSSVQVPLVRHGVDVDRVLAAIDDRTRAVIICNPNNPTGSVLSQDELAVILAGVPENCLVIVDEAYREFAGDGCGSAMSLLERFPHLAVVRTFSKAYGLANLRVGYLAASTEIASTVRRAMMPFSVSDVASCAALAALLDRSRLDHVVSAIRRQRRVLIQALREAGYPVVPSDTNFVWLPVDDQWGRSICDTCRESGISVMAFPGWGVRVTIPAVADMTRLLTALGSCGSRSLTHAAITGNTEAHHG